MLNPGGTLTPAMSSMKTRLPSQVPRRRLPSVARRGTRAERPSDNELFALLLRVR